MVNQVQLRKNFDSKGFTIGASGFKNFCWYFTNIFFFSSGLVPFSTILVLILRMYGAKIGKQVRIKPGVHIKYPWKLEIGDFSWLAACYIENLDYVIIGSNCCISQQAMLMTGNHDYKKTSFDLMVKPIILHNGVWVGAAAKVCPGVTLHSHSILILGSVATKDLAAYTIYQGNPAIAVKERVIS